MQSGNEETLQITVPSHVKKQVQMTALEQGETMRTFILKALRKQGIDVLDVELVDRRRQQSKPR